MLLGFKVLTTRFSLWMQIWLVEWQMEITYNCWWRAKCSYVEPCTVQTSIQWVTAVLQNRPRCSKVKLQTLQSSCVCVDICYARCHSLLFGSKIPLIKAIGYQFEPNYYNRFIHHQTRLLNRPIMLCSSQLRNDPQFP